MPGFFFGVFRVPQSRTRQLKNRALAITGHKKALKTPHTLEQSERMRSYLYKNRIRSALNPNEIWMGKKLAATGLKWTNQAMWGMRIFDWWCCHLGIAVEVDGPEHDHQYDKYRDEYNFHRSGIIVLHVRNKNEEDAANAMEIIGLAEPWLDRRAAMDLLTDAQLKTFKHRAPEVPISGTVLPALVLSPRTDKPMAQDRSGVLPTIRTLAAAGCEQRLDTKRTA